MTRTCDNCRRPVLETDTVCWHCGWKLSPTAPAKEKIAAANEEEGQESELEPTPLPLIVFYGSLTVLIIVGLFLLMNSLGQSPTITSTDPSSTEWVTLTDPERQFTVNIPVRWQWAFQDEDQTQMVLAGVEELDTWTAAAIDPLGTLVSDNVNLLLAGDDSILLVVMRSDRLNRLTPQQAVASLGQEVFEGILVGDTRQVQNKSGEDAAVFTIKHDEPELTCRQMLIPAPTAAYLMAVCTTTINNEQYEDEFNSILDSFQLLSR